MTNVSDFVRFMRMVNIHPDLGGCWIWEGNKPDGRYGHFTVDGKAVKAHRWLYAFLGNALSEGEVVRHRCDNPQCVNPDHLLSGTSADNTADMHERGRAANRQGERHPLVRLTEDQVRTIRALKAGGRTETSLAAEFGVGRGQIGKIARRENWRHI